MRIVCIGGALVVANHIAPLLGLKPDQKEILEDLIVTMIYGVALVGQIVMWRWWQRRGKRAAVPAIEKKSAYGRPLVRGT